MRAAHPEWSWLDPLFDEVAAQGDDVEVLRKDLDERKSAISALKKWVATSLVGALLAGAGYLRACGRSEGLAETAKEQAAEYRERVKVLEERVQANAVEIGRLQGLTPTRRTGTWVVPPRRSTTVPDIDTNGDQGP